MPQRKSHADLNQLMVRISWTAHRGAAADTGAQAELIMHRLLPAGNFVMTESHPDIILFMSGGSERRAIELSEPERPVLLLSIRGNNAYAAATEVMAWMVNNNRIAILSDAEEAAESGLLDRWRRVACAWTGLRESRAGLIGAVSEWLVASDVSAAILSHKFGINLIEIPWNTLPDYTGQEPDSVLTARFTHNNASGLTEAAQVLTLLRGVIKERELNALAVECFSLVQQRKVTACLALAQLNTEHIPAACEGDLASLAGMMLIRAVAGSVPWMANTTRLKSTTLMLSHCTAAFDFVSEIKLPTHYETDSSIAVAGRVNAHDVTLFRLSDTLDRAFIAEGRVVSHPREANACRTQVEIELPDHQIKVLREKPLGNHLLVVPCKCEELLNLLCRYKSIMVVS